MDNEWIAAEIKMRREQIAGLEKEINELKEQFSGGWKHGDVYEVPGGSDKGRYMVIRAPYNDDGTQSGYGMKVAKLKKDGTPSASLQYPYGIARAVKIESPAQE